MLRITNCGKIIVFPIVDDKEKFDPKSTYYAVIEIKVLFKWCRASLNISYNLHYPPLLTNPHNRTKLNPLGI